MRIEQQPAYLLHARAYRETSLLLELFTREYGRVGLIARGVRGPRRHAQRALLQPGRPLLLSWRDVGELPILQTVEPGSQLPRFDGDALFALLYVNELLLRLLQRRDVHASLFARYALLLSQLESARTQAEALRRFECAVLAECGYALQLDVDNQGRPLVPAALYRYQSDHGPQRLPDRIAETGDATVGAALLALRDDLPLQAEWLGPLRRLLRQQIGVVLGGRPLQAWKLGSLLAKSSADELAINDPD